MDGNGRMCRFLMNVMLASGGYDWVVITTYIPASTHNEAMLSGA